ncbi:MAG: AAA family ATPase [Clostridia bacterium]|nr:AAA family ATPase [Clostridia bacterium]
MNGVRLSKTGKTVEECSESFKDTVTKGYYVDKTLFIRDFLDGHSEVTLITRPRRVGKFLNQYFYDHALSLAGTYQHENRPFFNLYIRPTD